MDSEQTTDFFGTLGNASRILVENFDEIVLISGAWFAVHSIFVCAIRTKRTLDRQAFVTRSVAASIIGLAFSETVTKIISAGEIRAHPLWIFLSLFMIWQTYLIYLGIQRTNQIGISKWWNLLISIPATNNILYLLVIFFWRDKKWTVDHDPRTPASPEAQSAQVDVTGIPNQKLAN